MPLRWSCSHLNILPITCEQRTQFLPIAFPQDPQIDQLVVAQAKHADSGHLDPYQSLYGLDLVGADVDEFEVRESDILDFLDDEVTIVEVEPNDGGFPLVDVGTKEGHLVLLPPSRL